MKKSYLIISVLLVILIWINLAKPSFINKIRPRIIDFLEFPLKVATKSIGGLYSLATFQNRYERRISQLEERIAALTKSSVQTKELLAENERLRNLVSFKSRFAQKGIACEVIGRGQSNWDTFIIIDKGKGDGIRPNMSVAKEDGLIGRVFEIGENTAKIMLLDNPNSKISAAVQRTREQGILVGMGNGLCKLIYLSYDTDVKPGDIVIANPVINVAGETSSLSAKGMLIGKVIKILKDSRSLYASAIVKPSSNLFKIEEVLCIE